MSLLADQKTLVQNKYHRVGNTSNVNRTSNTASMFAKQLREGKLRVRTGAASKDALDEALDPRIYSYNELLLKYNDALNRYADNALAALNIGKIPANWESFKRVFGATYNRKHLAIDYTPPLTDTKKNRATVYMLTESLIDALDKPSAIFSRSF